MGKTKNKVRNSEIRKKCEIQNVTKFTRKVRRECDNYIARAEGNRLIKLLRPRPPKSG